MKQFISILLVFLSLQTFSQKPQEQWVKNVRGEFAITADMIGTAIDAKESARADAKRRALEQVCGQRVNIWDKMELSAAGESFNSLAVVQTDGEIVEFEVIKEDFEKSAVRSSEMIFYCIANVKVRTGIRPDPNFSAKADGIRSVYFENETLNVSVTPLQDCYLKIFIFENQGIGYLLYPNVNEPSRQFFANQTIAFPQVDEWAITKETDKPRETNQIVFVYTKTDWQFPAIETSRSEIEKWIMKIPADQRYIDIKTIEIRTR